jgi:hypothetical protein
LDARFGSDHDEGRAALRAGVLARFGRTVVERGGVGSDCVASIATDVAFSVKVSDWKKFRRERAVAKARIDRPGIAP